jgi:hypothetical protein
MKKLIIIVSLIYSVGIYSQENSTTSGGEGTGTGGTVSYSIGQIVYNTHSGINGNISQGLQQVYEVSSTVDLNDDAINLEIKLYPNPTTNYLTLEVSNSKKISYELSDMQGKVIENKKVKEKNTTIRMETLPNSIYLLKITEEDQSLKTFKIIKN